MKVGVRYWYNKGVALLEAELPERAVECFDRALKDEPGTAIMFKKGIALFYSGRLEEAAELFDQILDEDPMNYATLNNRGMTFLRQNKINDAKKCFKKAKERSQGNGCADLNINLINYQTENR